MRAGRMGFGATSAGVTVLALLGGCAFAGTSSPTAPSCLAEDGQAPTLSAGTTDPAEGNLVIVGRIVTMAEPAVAEALLIEDGVVTCVDTRDAVLERAGEGVPVVDIGSNVAYPGFIDAHAHWIGHRELYGGDSAKEAMDAALSRGWTSISEQAVLPNHLAELTALAEDDALRLRVDAYLVLNSGDAFARDYADREPGPIGDLLRVRGLKIALGAEGDVPNWEPADLAETIGLANDAGWQVSVHAVSSEAVDLALDAFEAVLGASGPNPLHHRIEHATEVSDDQLDRMAAIDLVTVIHPDGGTVDGWLLSDYLDQGADYPPEQIGWVTRFRDFVDAGLHVAAGTDAPWILPDFAQTDDVGRALTDDIGRPMDQIAGGMGRQLTAEEGLRAVTADAAYALGDESRRGHLAPGTLGDVTILSGDVLDATLDEIRALTVVATIVGGATEYCSDVEVCSQLDG